MQAWIILSLAAAGFQTLRFMLQKHLATAALSPGGATWARFLYSAPLVALLLAAYLPLTRAGFPHLGPRFWAFAVAGGGAQIMATMCIVALFARRNFAVGITFKKTEVVLTALVGLVVLGERISLPGLAAILLGLAGVLLLSEMPALAGGFWRRVANRSAALGLLAGMLFAVSGVSYRGASLEIASADPLLRAMVTLSMVTAMQTLALGLWLAWREPGEMGRVIAARRVAGWVGLTSMAGSICWFTAYTLQNAAYVNAVGQAEVILSLLASWLVFGERLSLREAGGIALITLSVLALILLL